MRERWIVFGKRISGRGNIGSLIGFLVSIFLLFVEYFIVLYCCLVSFCVFWEGVESFIVWYEFGDISDDINCCLRFLEV